VTELIAVEDLAAGYGGPSALEDVTFALRRGERIGVLGPNGGGKSTLFRKPSARGSTIRSRRSTSR